MIRLEQIRLLESKINKAVKLIEMLREENAALKRSVDTAQKRMQELDGLVNEFKADQEEIEKSLLRAMKNLERLEDAAAPDLEAPAARTREGEAAPAAAGEPAGRGGESRSSSRRSVAAAAENTAAAAEAAPEEESSEQGRKQELDIF